VDDFAAELADRFGAPPPAAQRMLEMARLRVCAHAWGVASIRREDNYLVFGYTDREKTRELVERSGGRLRIADAASAYLPIRDRFGPIDELLAEVKSLLRPCAVAA